MLEFLKDINNIQVFILFVFPGFISLKVWSLLYPTKEIKITDYLYEILFYSIVNYSLLFWLFLIINILQNTVAIVFIWILILVIMPIFWPIIIKSIFELKLLKGKIIKPIPSSWDYFFSMGETSFVLVHLNTGKLIGGVFIGRSYASSYPNEKDLYLRQVWKITNEGKFISKIQNTNGIYISFEAIEYIEFMKPGSNKKEKN